MNCEICQRKMVGADPNQASVCDLCAESNEEVARQSIDRMVLTDAETEFVCCDCIGSRLQIGELDGEQVLGCDRCKGLLLPRRTFASLIGRRRARHHGPDEQPPFDPNTDAPLTGSSRRDCPMCRSMLDSFFYAGPGRVAIDTCCQCEAVWLDNGEITRIERAPGQRIR